MTFHYISFIKRTKVTEQFRNELNTRGGLYVYPSNDNVSDFKSNIKQKIKNNLNSSPYKLIQLLNPIIRG